MRRAAKLDTNHTAICEVLRQMGASVLSLAAVGKGCPDIAIGYRNRTHLAEIKNGERRWSMTPDQVRFHSEWRGQIVVLDSVETAVAWVQSLNAAN